MKPGCSWLDCFLAGMLLSPGCLKNPLPELGDNCLSLIALGTG